jgi:hypothetical protein
MPAIIARAVAAISVDGPVRFERDYGPSVADHEIAAQRARCMQRGRRLFPALHAAIEACVQLPALRDGERTGLVLATSTADGHVIGHFRDAFLAAGAGNAGSDARKLDMMVALSRFVPGSILQDLAAMLGTCGPEVCLSGQCGTAPLFVAGMLIEGGRADAVVVVAVDPSPEQPAVWRAAAVLLSREAQPGCVRAPRMAPGAPQPASCIDAIERHLGKPAAPAEAPAAQARFDCVVRSARYIEPLPTDHVAWLQNATRLLDECLDQIQSSEVALIGASFLDLNADHALRRLKHGGTTHRATAALTLDRTLQGCAEHRGLEGPYLFVAGMPGASLAALAIGEDVVTSGLAPAAVIVAADRVGPGLARSLRVIDCPDRAHLRGCVAVVLLQRGVDGRDSRRMRVFATRHTACGRLAGKLAEHRPMSATASGCTSKDLAAAAVLVRSSRRDGSAATGARARGARFMGADAAVCLADQTSLGGRAAVAAYNELGGSGLILFG